MGSLNSFYVMGRVGRAPEQIGTRNGQPVVLFGVTTSAQGRAPIALEAAGPQAEQAMRLRRGQGVFVRGLLRVDVVDERPVLVAQVQALDLVVEGGGAPRAPRAPREGAEGAPAGAEGETAGAPGAEGVPVGEGAAAVGGEGQPDDEAIDAAPGGPGDELGARRRPRRRRGRGRRADGPRPEGGNGEGASAPAPRPERPELPPPAPIAVPARPVQPPSDPTYRSDMPF